MIRIALPALLEAKGWTQKDLSRVTGIPLHKINDLFHEMTERITLSEFDLICEALDCSLDELIVLTPNKTPKIDSDIVKSIRHKS